MSFSPSNAWKSEFSVVSSCRLALRVRLRVVYSFNLAVDFSNDFISSEVFQPNESVRFVLCELHAFSLSRKLHVYWRPVKQHLHEIRTPLWWNYRREKCSSKQQCSPSCRMALFLVTFVENVMFWLSIYNVLKERTKLISLFRFCIGSFISWSCWINA